MNKQRRKQIDKILARLQDCIVELEQIRDDEQEAFDNLPEGLQYSERGEMMEEYISDIDDVLSNLEDCTSNLDDIVNR